MSEPVPSSVHLGPLRLGSLVLDFPVVQAALSGHSDRPMRVLARRHGAPYTVHEVMLERFVREVGTRPRSRRQLGVSDDEHPIGAQLMGSEPSAFAPAALRLVRSGFDVIDINFGCPVRKVVSKGAGAGILNDIPKMVRMTEALVKATRKPVTVKTRLGWDNDHKEIVDITERLQDVGIEAITIHGRTRIQRPREAADWTLIGEVANNPRTRIPVFGNGDVFSPETALAFKDKYGVDGIMIGRGA